MIDEGISYRRLWRTFRAEMLHFDRRDPPNARIRHLIDCASVTSRETVIRALGSGGSNALLQRLRPADPANPPQGAPWATSSETTSGQTPRP